MRRFSGPGGAPGGALGQRCYPSWVKRRFSLLISALVLVVLIVVAPLVAPAQSGAPLPGMMPGNITLPAEMGRCCKGFKTGHWVEYAIRRVGGPRGTSRFRFAAVAREGQSWWLEMAVSQGGQGASVMKTLVRPGATSPSEGLQRMIIQPAGHLPLELPVEGTENQRPAFAEGGAPGVLVGHEGVRTPAGTFRARHYRKGRGSAAHHIWVSDRVGLWGVVQYRSPRVHLTLIGQGRGAASQVVGEAIPFDPSTIQ
jgi:hypothetical protein